MDNELRQFAAFLREHAADGLEALVNEIRQTGPQYAQVSPAELRTAIRQSFDVLVESIAHNDTTELIAYCTLLSQRRAMDVSLHEALHSMDLFRNYALDRLEVFLQDQPPWPITTLRRLEDIIRTFGNHFVSGFDDALQQAQSSLQAQAQQLETQQRTIHELGTPILPVQDGIIVLPLVGIMDDRRATQVMETLLEAIIAYQADMVILDITGVPVVDTSVIHSILRTVRAVQLVGAQIVLVGISPQVAQTIVQFNIDLSTITTRANLQEGIAFAFQRIVRMRDDISR